jgi:3-keto-5-aminohexanoate cleavage enzyme
LSPPVILTAALTGPIATTADNPNLPVTPEQIADAAEGAWRAGAAVVHVHLRDEDGNPTADLGIAERTVRLIEERCPALVQVSTGVGLGVPFEKRAALIELRPAMATLNVASMSFGAGEFRNPPDAVRKLAARMLELEVKPEIEIYDTGHMELALGLHAEELLADPLQFSIVMGVPGGMPASPEGLLGLVRRLPEGAAWQVVAVGRSNLNMTAIALATGGNARTGMEDTLTLRRGVPVASNAQLMERLAGVARALEREPMTPREAHEELKLASPLEKRSAAAS